MPLTEAAQAVEESKETPSAIAMEDTPMTSALHAGEEKAPE